MRGALRLVVRLAAERVVWRMHLTTDPACARFRAPRLGGWVDGSSRGHGCRICVPPAPIDLRTWL